MLTIVAGAAFAIATSDDAKELGEVAAKMADAKSYEFTISSLSEGMGGFGGRGGRGGRGGDEGGGEAREPTVTSGAYQKGLPMMVKSGETVGYKDGDQLVFKGEDGWQAFDRESMRGGRGGFGGRGGRGGEGGGEGRGQRGERGGEGRGERGGEGGGEGRGEGGGEGRGQRGGAEGGRGGFGGFDRGMMSMFALLRVEAPHGSFADFAGKVSDVTKSEKDGKVVYTGKLTEDGANSFGGGMFGSRGGRGGRGGGRGGDGGGPQMTTEGTFTVEVKDGVMTSATFKVSRSGSFGDRDFSTSNTRTFTFAKVGEAKVEVPADALAQFEI